MRRPAALIFLLAGLALSACPAPPESRVALSEPGNTAYDQRGVGIWYLTDGKKVAYYLHISPRKETAYLDVVGISAVWKEGDPVRRIRATAHASEIDGYTFYNVKRIAGAGFDYTAPGESPGFIIVRADVTEEDTLSLRFMGGLSDSSLRDSLKKGRVRGRKVAGKYKDEEVRYRMLDLSRPELVELIREVTPAKLFKEMFKEGPRFRRLRSDAKKANS